MRAPCSSRQRLALSETENSTRRINPIPSSHEQQRAPLLESGAPRRNARGGSRYRSYGRLARDTRVTFSSLFRLLLGIISGYTRLLPDKEAPDSH